MKYRYAFTTLVGTFYIVQIGDRFHPCFHDDSLGSYYSADQAAGDLAGGYTFSVPGGHDTSRLGIPDGVADWRRVDRPD